MAPVLYLVPLYRNFVISKKLSDCIITFKYFDGLTVFYYLQGRPQVRDRVKKVTTNSSENLRWSSVKFRALECAGKAVLSVHILYNWLI